MATGDSGMNLWDSAAHALEYLARADSIPHRTEGEAELIEWLPLGTLHVLDLGSGDGRLLGLVKLARPDSTAVALDFSDTMLERLGHRFCRDRTNGRSSPRCFPSTAARARSSPPISSASRPRVATLCR